MIIVHPCVGGRSGSIGSIRRLGFCIRIKPRCKDHPCGLFFVNAHGLAGSVLCLEQSGGTGGFVRSGELILEGNKHSDVVVTEIHQQPTVIEHFRIGDLLTGIGVDDQNVTAVLACGGLEGRFGNRDLKLRIPERIVAQFCRVNSGNRCGSFGGSGRRCRRSGRRYRGRCGGGGTLGSRHILGGSGSTALSTAAGCQRKNHGKRNQYNGYLFHGDLLYLL